MVVPKLPLQREITNQAVNQNRKKEKSKRRTRVNWIISIPFSSLLKSEIFLLPQKVRNLQTHKPVRNHPISVSGLASLVQNKFQWISWHPEPNNDPSLVPFLSPALCNWFSWLFSLQTILHPLCVKYPPSAKYRRCFLTELIKKVPLVFQLICHLFFSSFFFPP